MGVQILERSVRLPVPAAVALAWHGQPGAFERLLPPWAPTEARAGMGEGRGSGAQTNFRIRLGFWRMECREHRHEFADTPDGGCLLRDRVEYALPGGAAGRALGGGFARRKLESWLAYRHAVMRDDLAFVRDHAPARPLRVLVSGASGLIGSALLPFLTTQGHEVVKLVRRPARAVGEVTWNPEAGVADLDAAGEIDAVVHLAGAGIADARWTAARRREIRDSRVRGTRGLAAALAARARLPRVVVGGSATGFYGDAGDAWVDEGSPAGCGFLAELTQAWEAAWVPLDAAGVRRVSLRTGLVLSPAGGALARLMTPFGLGLGGRLGTGRQWCSWISIDDLVAVIGLVLADGSLRGPVNAVAPEPVTNAEFARELGRILHRPALLPAPAWALRLALGRGLADEALLTGQRVRPAVLAAAGHRFRHESVAAALRHVLGRV